MRGAVPMVLALVALALVACGGPPREARVALEETAGGLVVADGLVAEAVERRGEEVRAQVRAESRSGELAGETLVERTEAALDRFEELMAPTTHARVVLHVARDSLEAVELALDSWDAGADDGAGFLAAAACAVAALAEVARALEAAGVDLPAELDSAITTFSGLARGVCPEGE